MTAHGLKLLPSGLIAIEQGKRKVSAEELVALALILGVTPNRLLLPDRADDQPVALTPTTTVAAGRAWLWADGELPVPGVLDEDRREAELIMEFRQASRPVEHRIRESHPAYSAARSVVTRVGQLVDGERFGATRERMGELAAALRRAVNRVVEEARTLLEKHPPPEPIVLHISRQDRYTGWDDGVWFTGGEAVIPLDAARTQRFSARPGYIVMPVPVSQAPQLPIEPLAEWLANNPDPDEVDGGKR